MRYLQKKLFLVFIVACSLLATLEVNAQSSFDIISKNLESYKTDDEKLIFLIKKSEEFFSTGKKEGLLLAEKALNIARKNGNELAIARTSMILGVAFKNFGNNAESIENLIVARDLFLKNNEKYDYALALRNIGETYRANQNFEKAMISLNRALHIFEGLKDSIQIASTCNRIAATLYEDFYNTPEIKSFISKNKDYTTNELMVFISNNPLYKRKYQDIVKNLECSINISQRLQNNEITISTYIIYASFENFLKKRDEALITINKAISLQEKNNLNFDYPLSLYNKSAFLFQNKNYKSALDTCLLAYNFAQRSNIIIYVIMTSELLSEIYEAQGDYLSALKYYQIHHETLLQQKNNNLDLKIAGIDFNNKLKYNQSLLEFQKSRAKNLFFIFIIFFLILASFLVYVILSLRKMQNLNKLLKEKNHTIARQNKQLLEVNDEKDRMFSIIAHDLRGPFNGFLHFTQMLSHDNTFNEAELKEIHVTMHSSAINIFSLLENLLEWASLQIDKNLPPSTIKLQEHLHTCTSALKDIAEYKSIKLIYDIPEYLTITTLSSMLDIVLRNIISNAIKFSHKNSAISISADESTDGNYILITIKDTGLGMSKEVRENLFTVNKKYITSGTEGERGSGLGLYLTKEMLRKIGGVITVDSEPGKGTSFYLSIPANYHSNIL